MGANRALSHLSKTERDVVQSFVRDLREKLGDELVSVRLFGSKARGDFHADSDIDLFVLVKRKTPEVRSRLAEIAASYDVEYGLPLTPVLYDLFEHRKNTELGSFFFESVEREGVAL